MKVSSEGWNLPTVKLNDGVRVHFEWLQKGQHTVRWPLPIRIAVNGVMTSLAAGQANLYMYPKVTFNKVPGEPGLVHLSGSRLKVLDALIAAIAVTGSVFESHDGAGATPILGLMVANTAAAMELARTIYTLRPALLGQQHAPGPFLGETVFHVLAANRREEELCAFIQLAHDELDAESLRRVLTCQVEGGFFRELTTSRYGGTALGFAAWYSTAKVEHSPRGRGSSCCPSIPVHD